MGQIGQAGQAGQAGAQTCEEEGGEGAAEEDVEEEEVGGVAAPRRDQGRLGLTEATVITTMPVDALPTWAGPVGRERVQARQRAGEGSKRTLSRGRVWPEMGG